VQIVQKISLLGFILHFGLEDGQLERLRPAEEQEERRLAEEQRIAQEYL
jgi:hypothetical protein